MMKKKISPEYDAEKKIFTGAFLAPYLSDFRLSAISDVYHKRAIVSNWCESISSEKITYFKEEEVKSRFIHEIFGSLLGFSYKNAKHWLIREELKSKVGATKSDAALGSFQINQTGISNDVNIVVEVKDVNTNLDKPQNRRALNITPVDQAFLYASKAGGSCKWVVVTNFKEVRFYHYSSQEFYQSYQLADLENEDILKEFLFLFHKDRFTNAGVSATEKLYQLRHRSQQATAANTPIVDLLYEFYSKFKGLHFVDPDFLASLKPLNTSDEYVWHYDKGRLLSLNPAIIPLIKGISVHEGQLLINNELQAELKKAKTPEAGKKLTELLNWLYGCQVYEFCAPKDLNQLRKKSAGTLGLTLRSFSQFSPGEFVSVSTKAHPDKVCECINCRYRSFNLKEFISFVKESEHTHTLEPMEEAYGHYLLASDNFKKCYFLYKKTEIDALGEENKKISYFISKINQFHLHNLIEGFGNNGEKEILKDIRSIDLDRSIHNELDIYVDDDVRKYLIDIKENRLFAKIEKKTAAIIDKIEKGAESANDLNELGRQYNLLYGHFHQNFLVFDAFSDFKNLAGRIVGAMFTSLAQKGRGLTVIKEFFLVEAMLYVPNNEFEIMLKGFTDIEVSDYDKAVMVTKAVNLLCSGFDQVMGMQVPNGVLSIQLQNYHFEEKFTNIFANNFSILSRLELDDFQAGRLAEPVTGFMRTEKFLGHYDIARLGQFITRYGKCFKIHQLKDLIDHAVNGDHYGTLKYHDFLGALSKAYRSGYPETFIADKGLVKRAIANATDAQGRSLPRHLIPLYHILDEECKAILFAEFERALDHNFENYFFIELMGEGVLKWDEMEYFERYVRSVNQVKLKGFTGIVNGEEKYQDLYMINLIYQLYFRKIEPERAELKLLTNLSLFEQWAINPSAFDYKDFQAEWLIPLNQEYILEQLSPISAIRTALEKSLKADYQPLLSKIYFNYFC